MHCNVVSVFDAYGHEMRIFLAGATGVIGVRLVPLLVASGHVVAGMTRSASKEGLLRELGAEVVVCDVFEADALLQNVVKFRPDMVIHELTDLPDDASRIRESAAANIRIREEGTRNLILAAEAAKSERFIAQSVAWELGGAGGRATSYLESAVLAAGGVVLRYGQFYGPGTYHEFEIPEMPRIHIDEAARRTVAALHEPSGIIDVVEDPSRKSLS